MSHIPMYSDKSYYTPNLPKLPLMPENPYDAWYPPYRGAKPDFSSLDDLLDSLIAKKHKSSSPFELERRETSTSVIIEASLPGVGRDNINITIEDEKLTITAKMDGKKVSRTMPLDERKIQYDNALATYNDGILSVIFRKDSRFRKRRIQIS